MSVNPAKTIFVKGFVTKYGALAGRNLFQIERLLGFHPGRLIPGATFAVLDRLPLLDEFETAGYSQVAGHHHRFPDGLDPVGAKKFAMTAWSMSGRDRLIKVIATMAHNPAMSDDEQYPPGEGIPQWKLVKPIPATVLTTLIGNDQKLPFV